MNAIELSSRYTCRHAGEAFWHATDSYYIMTTITVIITITPVAVVIPLLQLSVKVIIPGVVTLISR